MPFLIRSGNVFKELVIRLKKNKLHNLAKGTEMACALRCKGCALRISGRPVCVGARYKGPGVFLFIFTRAVQAADQQGKGFKEQPRMWPYESQIRTAAALPRTDTQSQQITAVCFNTCGLGSLLRPDLLGEAPL